MQASVPSGCHCPSAVVIAVRPKKSSYPDAPLEGPRKFSGHTKSGSTERVSTCAMSPSRETSGIAADVVAAPRASAPITETGHRVATHRGAHRSEEQTSELQSLMRISYAVFCLKKKNKIYNQIEPLLSQHKTI